MDVILYKLLTKDKRARIYFIDNTEMMKEAGSFGKAAADLRTLMTFTCILRGLITNAKRVSVKLETSDSLAFLICGADANGDIQGYASDKYTQYKKTLYGEKSLLKISQDNGADDIFTGVVDIKEGDLTDNLARYFQQSEQTQTVFRYFCEMNESSVPLSRGVLVQALPFAEDTLIKDWRIKLEARKESFVDKNCSVDALMETLFSEAVVVEQQPVRFKCSCDRQMIFEMLMGLGIDDLEWALKSEENIEVRCGKCGKRYDFGVDDIRQMFGQSG